MLRLLLLCLSLLAFAPMPSMAWAADNIQYDKLPLAELKHLATQGEPLAQFYLGVRHAFGRGVPKHDEEAVAWWRKAAEQGVITAQYNLGAYYKLGQGVPQDYKEAANWFLKAAEQGHADAQNGLGFAYENGQGVPQNINEAVSWYRKAADQGLAKAQYNLGLRYANGEGVIQDYKQAVAWWRKAAEQGHASALNSLGVIYDRSRVPRDPVIAYALYNLAAAGGHDKAQGSRNALAEELSPRQIAEGQALSSKWKVGTPLPSASKTGNVPESRPLAANAKPAATPPRKTGNCRPSGPSIRCQSRCTNGNCIVTYENGCEIQVQVQPKFNPFNSQWEYPAPGC